jgi:hypothetical protein
VPTVHRNAPRFITANRGETHRFRQKTTPPNHLDYHRRAALLRQSYPKRRLFHEDYREILGAHPRLSAGGFVPLLKVVEHLMVRTARSRDRAYRVVFELSRFDSGYIVLVGSINNDWVHLWNSCRHLERDFSERVGAGEFWVALTDRLVTNGWDSWVKEQRRSR